MAYIHVVQAYLPFMCNSIKFPLYCYVYSGDIHSVLIASTAKPMIPFHPNDPDCHDQHEYLCISVWIVFQNEDLKGWWQSLNPNTQIIASLLLAPQIMFHWHIPPYESPPFKGIVFSWSIAHPFVPHTSGLWPHVVRAGKQLSNLAPCWKLIATGPVTNSRRYMILA